MELLTFFGRAEEDPGTPVVFVKGATEKETVTLIVRRIPVHIEREIEKRHGGKTQNVLMKQKGGQITIDGDRSAAEAAEKAAYALMDTKNWEIKVGDADGAQFFTELLGRTVTKGEVVNVDGQWGTPVTTADQAALMSKLKAAILPHNREFARKVVTLSKTLNKLVAASIEEEEEGKEQS